MIKKVSVCFEKRFYSKGRLFCAPGRINLIGEHTDYNNGYVLPASITNSVYGMYKENFSDVIRIYSMDNEEYVEFKTGGEIPVEQWAKYIFGIICLMYERGKKVGGFNCVFGGNIPTGAGLSSSAALENLFSYSLNTIFNLGFTKTELVVIGQECEHKFIGVNCGIMDQFTSMFGKRDKVILLDCNSLTYRYEPLDLSDNRIVLLDTGVKHSLASTEYNKRREECEKGVHILNKYDLRIKSLRDVEPNIIEEHKEEMSDIVYKRCRYVVEENLRVLSACDALEKGEFDKLGRLMTDSHNGLKFLYDVSCIELDTLVDAALEVKGLLGTRMMGGGFGGCTINLIRKSEYKKFIGHVTTKYSQAFGTKLRVIDVKTGDGTREIYSY